MLRYSGGSKIEHVWFSNGRICSIFKWRSVFEWSAIFAVSLGRFIYNERIILLVKQPRLKPFENRTFENRTFENRTWKCWVYECRSVFEYFRFYAQVLLFLCTGTFVFMNRYFCFYARVLLFLCSGTFVFMVRFFCFYAQVLLFLCSGTFVFMLRYFCFYAQVLSFLPLSTFILTIMSLPERDLVQVTNPQPFVSSTSHP